MLVFIFLFSFSFIPAHFLNPNIESYDDRSYLAHAFTLGLDWDLDYENERAIRFNRAGTLPSHPIGSGFLAAPFVAIFSIVDRVSGNEIIIDRSAYFGSWSYFGFLFAVNLFFLLGVNLYFRALKTVYTGYTFGFHLVVIMGTGVIYYVLGRFTMSHGFEFFVFSATVYLSVLLQESHHGGNRAKSILYALLLGFLVVLNLWVRPSNLNCLFLPFIWLLILNLYSRKKIETKWYFSIALSIVVWLVPYWTFNWHYYQQLFPSYSVAYSVGMPGAGIPEGFINLVVYVLSLVPNIFALVFSSEVGIIYSDPILVIGFIGFIYFLVTKFTRGNRVKVGFCALMVLFYYAYSVAIVLVWKTTASDYGYRYLFPVLPVATLFVAVLLRDLDAKQVKWRKSVKYAILGLSIVGIVNVYFYKVTPALSPVEQENVYGEWHSSSLKGYEMNLIRELGNYQTFVLAVGKTYIGFIVAPLFLDTELVEIVPREIKEKYLPRFRNIPLMVYLQTFVLMLLWAGCGWYRGPQKRK